MSTYFCLECKQKCKVERKLVSRCCTGDVEVSESDLIGHCFECGVRVYDDIDAGDYYNTGMCGGCRVQDQTKDRAEIVTSDLFKLVSEITQDYARRRGYIK